MKKLIALPMVVVMAVSAVACSAGGSEAAPAPEAAPAAEAAPEAAAPEAAPAEEKKDKQLVYGITSTMAGDLGFGQWSSVGGDRPVYCLIDAYAPTCYDQNAQWVWDKTVVAEHDIQSNEDGTLTYTVKINDGLKFSDGSDITAKNFVAYPLLFASPAAVAKDAYGRIGKEFVGQAEYKEGSAATFAGLRLIDDKTFQVIVGEKYNPYYYGLALLNFFPIPYTMWLNDAEADVKDDGEGAYFTASKEFNAANYGDAINDARFIYENRVCSGPYYLESLDAAANEAVMRKNPYYLGNFEGQVPAIDTIIVKAVNSATMLDQLQNGEVDLIDNIGDGALINACFDLAETGEFGATNYKYSGIMILFMQCDWGPQQFEEVRKALTYLTDREAICQKSTLGFGEVVNAEYSSAQWMTQAMEEELASELIDYSYNPEKAVEVLKEGGWIYNADGSEYVDGSGLVRYKKVTADQAKYNDGIMPGCVEFEDGYLMPLHLEYIGHTEGEGIESTLHELVAIHLIQADTTKNAGVEFGTTVTSDGELLSYLNRRGTDGANIPYQSYSIFSLASGLSGAKFDESGGWQEGNLSAFWDDELESLADNMIYGVEAGDDETFLKIWYDYQLAFNAKMPFVPVYNWTYCAVYNNKLQNFNETNIWDFRYAILYADVVA